MRSLSEPLSVSETAAKDLAHGQEGPYGNILPPVKSSTAPVMKRDSLLRQC
jgi:hypothetical protein